MNKLLEIQPLATPNVKNLLKSYRTYIISVVKSSKNDHRRIETKKDRYRLPKNVKVHEYCFRESNLINSKLCR